MSFQQTGKIGRPGAAKKKFDFLSMKDQGYRIFLAEWTPADQLQFGLGEQSITGRRGGATPHGVEIEWDAFGMGDLIVQPLGYSCLGSPQSGDLANLGIEEVITDSGGVINESRSAITSLPPLIERSDPCAELETLSLSLDTPIIMFERTAQSSSDFAFRVALGWRKNTGEGGLCAGAPQATNMKARVFVKSDLFNGVRTDTRIEITEL